MAMTPSSKAIAGCVTGAVASFGAESIVMGYGTGRENEAVIYRFANLLGTPNILTAGDFWKRHGYLLPPRKVVQIGECRLDHEMLNDTI